jgi:PAS domain S-box-containing protein
MVGVNEDITERQEAELALEVTQQRFRRLVEISMVGVWTTDNGGNNTYVSPRWREITGIPPEKAAGSGWAQGVHPEDREMISAEWCQASLEKRPYISRFRFLHPAGRVVSVLCQALFIEKIDGTIGEWVGTILELSDHDGVAGRPPFADGLLPGWNDDQQGP